MNKKNIKNEEIKPRERGVILATLENGKEITDVIYEKYLEDKNKSDIAEMIFYRLYGRYLKPFTFKDNLFKEKYKNGFSIMANCCLCIEALQSFKNGWGETPRDAKGNGIFDEFFNNNSRVGLKIFSGKSFYKNIRCGILHQGETTSGWRILRGGELLKEKTINSVKFLEKMIRALDIYRKELENSEWDSEVWDNCRTKMRKILKNCE